MIASSKGVIHGFTGVEAVDVKHQIFIVARANGAGYEHELLHLGIRATQTRAAPTTHDTADAGFHFECNSKALDQDNIKAQVDPTALRQRD